MAQKSKRGKQKRYGPKMADPRIKTSKEHRNCGPLGRYVQWKRWIDKPHSFHKPTVMPYFGAG